MINAVASEACPVEALRNDHRRAMRLVGLLVERIDRLRRLQNDDLLLTHDIFRYMVDFVDGRHHAREDRVIDALVAREPQLRCHVERISEAHDELGREGDILLRELSTLRERYSVDGKLIVPRLANYAAALSAHFEAEERELFNRAGALLTAEDWRGIESGDEDPLFGPQVERGFESLFDAYVGRVREMGAPSRARGPLAAAVMVDSAAALLGGAREAASAVVSGSKRAMHANLAGVSAVAQSRSLLDFAAATSAWTTGAVDEAKAAVRRIREVTKEATHSTLDPVNSAFGGSARQFAASHRVDNSPASWQAHLVNLGLRAVVKRAAGNATIERIRQPRSRLERMLTALDDDVVVTSAEVGGGFVEFFEIAGVEAERTVLHLPGGGFIMEPTQAHRLMAARLARQARARVALVHYRLAPEHPFPAGLDDCVAAYRYLLETGTSADNIILMGDSAGGCLTFSSLLRLRQAGVPLPAGAAVISPVTDLSYGGASRNENRWADPSLPNDERNMLGELYVGDVPTDDPFVSPLFGDLSNLPPVLVQVGSVEVLLDDALRIAAKIRALGGECECEVWHEMPHDWLLFGMLPEAKKALSHVVQFIERHAPAPASMNRPAVAAERQHKVLRWPTARRLPALVAQQAA